MGSGEKVDFHRRFRGATRRSGIKERKLDSQVQPHQPPIRCPQCSSERIWRDGIRTTSHGDVQRYLCRSCGLRFSESTAEFQVKVDVPSQRFKMFNSGSGVSKRPVCEAEFSIKEASDGFSLSLSENVSSHDASKIASEGKSLKVFRPYTSNCRVSVSEVEAKNLVKVESRQKWAAGATEPSEAKIKSKIVEYLWWAYKQGYKESTIKGRTAILKNLMKRGADLEDPESVKEVIAQTRTWKEGRKANVVDAYNSYAVMKGIKWTPPRYKRHRSIPYIPFESDIDQFIAAAGKTVGTFTQGIKETGARPGEFIKLEWVDIDKVNRTIKINKPEKGSNPRIIPVSSGLIARFEVLPRRGPRVFNLLKTMGQNFRKQRKRLARKFNNPRLLKLTWKSLRHWKGTMEYHKTKDIIHVKEILGHKSITNTMIYINLEAAIFRTVNDEFNVRVAHSLEEACKLLEVGFEYVTEMDGARIFRKRK